MRYLSISAVICSLILTELVTSNLIGMRNTCKCNILSKSIACFFTAFSVATHPTIASDSQPNSYGLKGYVILLCENSDFYKWSIFVLMGFCFVRDRLQLCAKDSNCISTSSVSTWHNEYCLSLFIKHTYFFSQVKSLEKYGTPWEISETTDPESAWKSLTKAIADESGVVVREINEQVVTRYLFITTYNRKFSPINNN